jgi:hypothetical protein
MWMMEWKSRSASSRTAFSGGQERQAQSTAAGVIRLLDGGLRPIPTTRPHPGPPITRTCVRRVHGTVPAPTLRRLASAPLSGPGLCNDIAKVGQAVKNKVRTLSLTHLPRHGRDGKRARTRKGSGRVIPGRASARARKPSPLRGRIGPNAAYLVLRRRGDGGRARPAGAPRNDREAVIPGGPQDREGDPRSRSEPWIPFPR